MKNLSSVFKNFKGVDAVLIQNPSNTFYLTGYQSDFAFILLTNKGNFYFTDTRYTEEAFAACGKAMGIIAVSARDVYQKIYDIIVKVGATKIGFENGKISYDDYSNMKSVFQNCSLLGIDERIASVRSIKTSEELRFIKKAAQINDKAFARTLKKIKSGITEKQIAYELEYQMRKLGADGTAFSTIVAFGTNTSKPHAHTTDKKLEKGMPVTIDFGCKFMGYCSDITRTFSYGEPLNEFVRVYNSVLNANVAGIEAVRAGISARSIDAVCRDCLKNQGLDKFFLHGTGHGVGVDIHEAPIINANNDGLVKKNMVITVEPGVYMEGLFGVRIEDLIFVENDGCKVISQSDKKLLIL